MVRPPPGLPGDRRLALLVANAVDYAIFLLDVDGHVQTWNAGAERMQGYRAAEIVGRHFSTFYTEEDVARDHPADELRIAEREGRYEEEGWRVRKDGSRFWANVVITALRDEGGTLVGFGKVSRDLTARRLGEEQLRSRALELQAANHELTEFRRLVTSVRDYAIFMLDPTGRILTWNAGARQLKGWEAAEIVGEHFSIFYGSEDRARDHPAHELELAVRDGRYEEEGWRFRKDGSRFWASVTITTIRDEDGRHTGFAKVTRDLTERRAAEEGMRAALEQLRAANEELDRFATVAAHDMTVPLQTISGFAQLLDRDGVAPEDRRQYAGHIRDSSADLLGMLGTLLEYARSGRPEAAAEPVDLGRVAERVVADLAGPIGDRGVAVTCDLPPHVTVLADPGDVRSLLQNLLSNAVRFASADEPSVHVGAGAAGRSWQITVRDNGPGIPPDDRRRVFGAFERSRGSGGYGLGLAICQRLVERHGGAIGVDAAPGGGSAFWFTLPAGERSAAFSRTGPPERPCSASSPRRA